jgi:hypothetical protein
MASTSTTSGSGHPIMVALARMEAELGELGDVAAW